MGSGFEHEGGFQISNLKSQISDCKPQLVARVPLHHWHATHGARFTERDGWKLTAAYTSVEEELSAARTGVGLADISAFGKISLHGAGVAAVARGLVGTESAFPPGAVARIAADPSVFACRLAADQLLLLAADSRVDTLERRLANIAGSPGLIRHDVTSGYAGFALVGPASETVLRQVTALDVSPTGLPAATCAQTALAGVHSLIVRLPGDVLPATRVYVATDLAEHVWNALLTAGKTCGMRAIGFDAFELTSRG